MRTFLKQLVRPFVRFRDKEDGSATIEFVLIMPMFLLIFASTYEAGLMQVRHMMLERGLDLAVRTIRLNTDRKADEDSLKRLICNNAGIIDDCLERTRVEMVVIDPTIGFSNGDFQREADCVNLNEPAQPARGIATGQSNDMMMIRACVLFDPWFPHMGLGKQIQFMPGNTYALVSMNAFVMEPE